MGRLSTLISLLALAACACAATPAPTSGPLDDGFLTLRGTTIPVHQELSRLPLLVAINREASEWNDTFERAIDEWNARLGFVAFIHLGVVSRHIDPVPGVVPVTIDPSKHDEANTRFRANPRTGVMLGCIVVLPVYEYGETKVLERVAEIIAMHELGHVLGLAHDHNVPASLMNPTFTSTVEEPTALDIGRLRKQYSGSSDTVTPAVPELSR